MMPMTSFPVAARVFRAVTTAAVFAAAALGPAGAMAESCRSAVGERESARLVERCISVSPATRPPCNADNACSLIESEIARGCEMIDDGTAPSFCRDY